MAIIDDAVFAKLLSKITEGNTQNPVNWKYTAFFTDSNNNKIEVHNVLAVSKISKYSTAISNISIIHTKYSYLIINSKIKINSIIIIIILTITSSSF